MTMDDRDWLAAAVAEAWRCPASERAFSVGAIIVAGGTELARGHSRESDAHVHAEEAALGKLSQPPSGSTIYSSLEPCGARASRPRTCAELIIAAGIRRVVFAWREPPIFVAGGGGERLAAAGVTVLEVPELADAARAPNRHLLDK